MTRTQRLIRIIYDGECPFCASYVRLQRLRSEYSVELIDARESNPLVADLQAQGIDFDEGMVVMIGDDLAHGADAMHQLSLLASEAGVVRRIANWLFSSPVRSRTLYPILRMGRNLVLRILGRKKMKEI